MKLFISEYNSNSPSTFLILIAIIIIIIIYFLIIPLIQSSFNKQGGKQIIESEININSLTTLANYQQLNDTDAFDYRYAISFWVFIESLPPNTNPNYNKFISILNYGDKPNVLYKSDTNTLIITMDQEQLHEKGDNRFIEYDDNGKRIIYKNTNLLLQKWNNIIINYIGGTLDIFLNGKLVKSAIEVIPYMKYDSLTIGSDNGINGGICNLLYYKTPLTLTNIYYIYNNLKDKNPPVVNYYNKTIIS
jgi:type II secretory pathway pseudopilin PulG